MSSRRNSTSRLISGASSSQNKRLGALTVFLLGAVAYTNFYLPQFSEESEKRRLQIQHIRESGGDVPKTQLSAGSTWLNMAKIRDATK
jgi:hypothetical protein